MILVSACLVGRYCRYDGGTCKVDWVIDLVDKGLATTICPEAFGGLSTPRNPSEIICKHPLKILNDIGEDITGNFVEGAQKSLDIAKSVNATCAILKSKSPSCGKGKIYSGNFDGSLIDGNGVTVDAFIKNGIKVFNENEKEEFYKYQNNL